MAFLPKKSYRFLSTDRDASGPNSTPNSSSVAPEPLFEFDESDLWTSNHSTAAAQELKSSIPTFRLSKKSSKKADRGGGEGVPAAARSLPVSIPEWSKMRFGGGGSSSSSRRNDQVEEDDEDDYAKVPPHEYLMARQTRNGEMGSFSVHEGRGRTLKGRDLSRVRNAIFAKTGFED